MPSANKSTPNKKLPKGGTVGKPCPAKGSVEVVFPLAGDYKIRLKCRRGSCTGVLEMSPAELAAYEAPVIQCPTCTGELSSGMRGSFSGDKCKLVGILFQGLTNGTWCNTFGVELVRKS